MVSAATAQDGSVLELPLPDPGSAPAAAFRLANLELESSEANEITDTDAWWKRNRLQSPELYVRCYNTDNVYRIRLSL